MNKTCHCCTSLFIYYHT